MSVPFRRQALAPFFALLLSLSAAPFVQASESEDLYRCRVLGDGASCEKLPAKPADAVTTKLVPGPYASYLIYNGRPVEQAIAQARGIGEEPTLQVIKSEVRRETGSFEAYQRYVRGGPTLGSDDAPHVERHAAPSVR